MFARRVSNSTGRTPVSVSDDIGPEVLAFLSHQGLPATPPNYTLGFLVVANAEGLAARAVDAVVMQGDKLTQKEADRILAAHGPVPEPAKGEDEDRAKVRRQTLALAELAAAAVETTGDFGRALAAEQTLLAGSIAIAELVATMIERTDRTEQQLAKASQQIEDLRQEVETAKGDAHHDSLTGLCNRRGVLSRLRTVEPSQRPLVGMCDVDRFKTVNDRYGHVVGDRVLKLVATSLQESCGEHFVARWGGEEFVVVFAPDTSKAEALAVLDKAREDLGQRNVRLRSSDEPLGVLSFSAGIAPFGDRTLDEAIAGADVLLYKAKANGRNQVLIAE